MGFIGLIESAFKANEDGIWVDVGLTLPETNRLCLVYDGKEITLDKIVVEQGRKKWESAAGATHWLLVPEPPQDAGKKKSCSSIYKDSSSLFRYR
ncbi:MAG: hypothetical protein HQL77_19225 [Magnetococcales bacterium]|nr:hypothetical protein [Magnetococcales bacterium]